MKVTPTLKELYPGVPNYYNVYSSYMSMYKKQYDNHLYTLAIHYARLAEEFGQAIITDDDTYS